jgi:SpoVK/Ycf46/Vps4 family AAA+-type ATPase
MARSDLLLSLVKAGTKGDRELFKRSVEALVAEERAKQHHVLADRLAEQLVSGNGVVGHGPTASIDDRIQSLLFEIRPRRTLNSLVLPESVRRVCDELTEECNRADLLRSHNLEPRHRVLLVGPPGNGKTSLAEALANELSVPMLIVRYEGLIGSFLGETAARLRILFEYVRTRQCVLFFDEFDTIGKERGDLHETGEIKRVVSSLLLQIDSLPSYVIVVTATNHPELLDRAVWRRFQLRIYLPSPGKNEIAAWLRRFEETFGHSLDHSIGSIVSKLAGLSFSEVEDFATDIQRQYVLALPEANLRKIVTDRLRQWEERFEVNKMTPPSSR